MITMTLAQIASAVDGRLNDAARPDAIASCVSIDSRTMRCSALFVALPGERVDGNDFAAAAMSSGATAVMSVRSLVEPCVIVDDPVIALGDLARHHLSLLPKVTVVAITGSLGKTTTKDLLSDILAGHGSTVAAAGSYNNELGLPLTILNADESTRFLVLEMGARGGGHIKYLCDIARPSVGIELMVGKAHIGEFGGTEAIARAKEELVAALPSDGTAILNYDDPLVRQMATQTSAAVVWFGSNAAADVRIDDLSVDAMDRASFRLITPDDSAAVHLQLNGRHLATNAVAAAAAAWSLGVSTQAIAEQLSSSTPKSRWRMEVSRRADDVTIINDAYNASPESMAAALGTLTRLAAGYRSWAVLGEMRELGGSAADEHERVGRLTREMGVDHLVVVGEAAQSIYSAAQQAGADEGQTAYVADLAEAAQLLQSRLAPGDVVLVKASRAAHLEVLCEWLLSDGTEAYAGSLPERQEPA